jgi:hypothetical protein
LAELAQYLNDERIEFQLVEQISENAIMLVYKVIIYFGHFGIFPSLLPPIDGHKRNYNLMKNRFSDKG